MIVAVEVTYLILVDVESLKAGITLVDNSLPNIFNPQTGKREEAGYDAWVMMPKDKDVSNPHGQ